MDWMESVKARLKRKNQVLFSPKDDLLAPLALLLEGQDRRAVVLWAFALVEESGWNRNTPARTGPGQPWSCAGFGRRER